MKYVAPVAELVNVETAAIMVTSSCRLDCLTDMGEIEM